ncbi:hypothetical protein D3C87_1860760 [compost metagenome]
MINPVDELVHHGFIHDGIDNQMEAWVRAKVGNIFYVASGQIIDYPDLITSFNQGIGQMRPDEASSPRN